MTKSRAVNPFGDQDVTGQLDSWAAALEMAVATLQKTLTEVRTYQGKELGDDDRDGTAGDDAGSVGGRDRGDQRDHGPTDAFSG